MAPHFPRPLEWSRTALSGRRIWLLFAAVSLAACADHHPTAVAPAGPRADVVSDVPGLPPSSMAPSLSRAGMSRGKQLAPTGPNLDVSAASGGLQPFYTEVGKLYLSIDGAGTTGSSAIIQVQKPAGATVRRAFLLAASTGFSGRELVTGDVTLDGTGFDWAQSVRSAISSWNHEADVTSIVKPVVDGAAPGRVNLTVSEVGSGGIDGEILAVVFDDPNQTQDNTITLLFGAQKTSGDDFYVSLANPLDTGDPTLKLDMGLGISFGWQAPGNGAQHSNVDVNGARMTSCAGGQDDGGNYNGSLITVGGLDDSDANPPDPNSCGGALGDRQDDELYDLRPFARNGDTQIHVHTVNPSNDDNIFFASLFMTVKAAVTVVLPPPDNTPPTITPVIAGTLGANDWYTSDVTLTWTVADAESAVSSRSGCDASSVTSDTQGLTFTCSATSGGGTASKSVTIKRDATPPALTPNITGTLGTNGWYTSDVTVSWAVSDLTSGIGSSTGCAASTLSSDGQATYTCQATNGAGLAASNSASVKRDATPPVITYTGNAGSYTVDLEVAITCAASDATSGVATTTCQNISGDAWSFGLGSHTYSADATDKAGNIGHGQATFTVSVTYASLAILTRRWTEQAGVANALCQKLDAAAAAAARGDATAASNIRDAYLNAVQAQSGKALPADKAAVLAELAMAL